VLTGSGTTVTVESTLDCPLEVSSETSYTVNSHAEFNGASSALNLAISGTAPPANIPVQCKITKKK
jgi:hypothetical protein